MIGRWAFRAGASPHGLDCWSFSHSRACPGRSLDRDKTKFKYLSRPNPVPSHAFHLTTTVMPSSSVTPQLCYFSFVPSSQTQPQSTDYSSHYSIETPSPGPNYEILSPRTPSEPSNPLLAARNPPPACLNMSATMDPASTKVLQLQTAAAYRPRPQPVQDVLDLSPIDTRTSSSASDTSSSSTSSARGSVSSASTTPVLQFVRCSRCHRSGSQGSKDMVGWGMNSYYCARCADLVGYQHG
ncbi:hypothetical protein HDK77DRAFT_502848 [Phyllosticta capitalensis]